MASDGYEHTFHWHSSEPQSVIVTGTFDDWRSTLVLERLPSGKFSGKAKLPYNSKVLFKYVIDGHWQANNDEPVEWDSSGNCNNVLTVPDQPAQTELPQPANIGLASGATGLGVGAAASSYPYENSTPIREAEVPGEAPADPAPTPAISTADQVAIPTVPSGDQLSEALKDEPTVEPSDPVVPLVPATDDVKRTSFAEADQSAFNRVVPDPPTSAGALAVGNTVEDSPAELANEHQTQVLSEPSTDAPQLPPLSPAETGLGVFTATAGDKTAATGTSQQRDTLSAHHNTYQSEDAYTAAEPSPALPSPVLYPTEFNIPSREVAKESAAPESTAVKGQDTTGTASVTPKEVAKEAAQITEAPVAPESTAVKGKDTTGAASIVGGTSAVQSQSDAPATIKSESPAATKVETLSPTSAAVGSSATDKTLSPSSATATSGTGKSDKAIASSTAPITDKIDKPVVSSKDVVAPSSVTANGPSTTTSSPAVPAKESPKVPVKEFPSNKTPPTSVSDKKGGYATLGKASAPEVKDSKDPFTTPTKHARNATEPSSTTSTPAKTYTAPSTPSTPPQFKGDRARKASFFQKVKNAFSPNKKSTA